MIAQRPKCKYGINCYRKNPQHKKDFSHPGDLDYNNQQVINNYSDSDDGASDSGADNSLSDIKDSLESESDDNSYHSGYSQFSDED